MEKLDISTYSKSDQFYLSLIGDFVRSTRIDQNRTQKDVATAAGINRSTLVQIEKGQAVNLISLIQVLRTLKKLNVFKEFEVKPVISPLKLAALEQKIKHRVRGIDGNISIKNKPKSDW